MRTRVHRSPERRNVGPRKSATSDARGNRRVRGREWFAEVGTSASLAPRRLTTRDTSSRAHANASVLADTATPPNRRSLAPLLRCRSGSSAERPGSPVKFRGLCTRDPAHIRRLRTRPSPQRPHPEPEPDEILAQGPGASAGPARAALLELRGNGSVTGGPELLEGVARGAPGYSNQSAEVEAIALVWRHVPPRVVWVLIAVFNLVILGAPEGGPRRWPASSSTARSCSGVSFPAFGLASTAATSWPPAGKFSPRRSSRSAWLTDAGCQPAIACHHSATFVAADHRDRTRLPVRTTLRYDLRQMLHVS